MKKKILLIIGLVILIGGNALYSQTYTISGTLKDSATGEDLIGATIFVKELSGTGTITNTYGFYSLSLTKGNYTIIYRFIGYQDQEFIISLDKDITKNLELQSSDNELNEIVVSAEKENSNVTKTEMGVSKIVMKDIENIPVLFGEKDVMKTIQLMPGVKSAGEGSAGFYVRGGGADQNLILLDGAPVYNASHMMGFFSVFNSDALKDVKLYTGSMPAEYGGRLSSVMDIKMKEGNSKELSVSGGIGLISSKLTIEAPLVKNKGSFIVSGRRTYADLFLKLSSDEDLKNTTMYFYDVNAKANYQISKKDRLFLSGYFGRDDFGFSSDFGFDWGNTTATLRWNHIFSNKLFSNTSLIYSKYSYKIDIGTDVDSQISSSIEDFNLKQDFDYYLNAKNTLKFGGNIIHHNFIPGEVEAGSESFVNSLKIENRYSIESALYLSNEHKINDKLTLDYGLRFSNFTQIGPGDIYSNDGDGNVMDTTIYGDLEKVSSYNGWSPRFSASYVFDEDNSIKASYARTNQYLHLISNSTSTSPTDIWLPSSNNIKPQIGNNFSIGYFRNFNDNMIEFSSEIYYKTLQNTIDYRTGAQVTLNPAVEGELLFGDGRAYGLELLLKKRKGRFTGWLSYTLAKTENRFDEINDGGWHPAKQDRTHDISIVGTYKINDRLDFSATWVYYTGNAVTFPSGKYEMDGQIINYYTERNGYRMPDYHRLDLGLTLHNKNYKLRIDPETGKQIKVKKKYSSSWNFSVYNAYSRENAYSISFEESESVPGTTEAIQLSLFKIVPSVSYNFKF